MNAASRPVLPRCEAVELVDDFSRAIELVLMACSECSDTDKVFAFVSLLNQKRDVLQRAIGAADQDAAEGRP